MELVNKRALVTGASRGLGRTLVFALANGGAREVFAGARDQNDIESLKSEASTAGLPITPIKLDVTVSDDVIAAGRLAPIDLLINNAGIAIFGSPLTIEFNAIEDEMAVNYFGALRMVRAFAPAMIQQGSGMIVNVATAFARMNLPIVANYCASKAALLSLGQALRAYLNDFGVKVITVMPTTFDSDMSRGADVPKMTKEFVAAGILAAIRDETYDPPIGDEAKIVFESLRKDPVGFEKMLAQFKAI
ncbi:MAG TPA: SDR family NAD(P)-dependent oxidoreductase [Pyrinomonadaceae bacterium]